MMSYPVQSPPYSPQYQKALAQFKQGDSVWTSNVNTALTNKGLIELTQALQADLSQMKLDIGQIKSRLNLYG